MPKVSEKTLGLFKQSEAAFALFKRLGTSRLTPGLRGYLVNGTEKQLLELKGLVEDESETDDTRNKQIGQFITKLAFNFNQFLGLLVDNTDVKEFELRTGNITTQLEVLAANKMDAKTSLPPEPPLLSSQFQATAPTLVITDSPDAPVDLKEYKQTSKFNSIQKNVALLSNELKRIQTQARILAPYFLEDLKSLETKIMDINMFMNNPIRTNSLLALDLTPSEAEREEDSVSRYHRLLLKDLTSIKNAWIEMHDKVAKKISTAKEFFFPRNARLLNTDEDGKIARQVLNMRAYLMSAKSDLGDENFFVDISGFVDDLLLCDKVFEALLQRERYGAWVHLSVMNKLGMQVDHKIPDSNKQLIAHKFLLHKPLNPMLAKLEPLERDNLLQIIFYLKKGKYELVVEVVLKLNPAVRERLDAYLRCYNSENSQYLLAGVKKCPALKTAILIDKPLQNSL